MTSKPFTLCAPAAVGLLLIAVLVAPAQGQNPPNRPNVCTGHSHGSLVRNTRDCATYYHCFNGQPILSSCADKEYFNPLTRRCDRAENVECFQCPPDQVFIDVPVANECQQFVRCFNNQTEQLTCAEGLFFDRSVQMCNHRQNVTCPFEVQCPREHEEMIFTRDRDNCAKFYVCIGGAPLPRTCPQTLFFNPATNQCDHPASAGCPKMYDWINDDPVKETFRCPDQGGPLFPHQTDCRKFHTCSGEGLALTHTCPNGAFFDFKYMFCGQRSDVTCYIEPRELNPAGGNQEDKVLLLN